METATDSRVSSLLVLYDMHTDYFNRAIEGISDEDAHQRLNTKANHIAWIAGSLVHERYELIKSLGIKDTFPRNEQAEALYKDHKGIQDNVKYPPLSVYKNDWKTISPQLRAALANASDEQLNIEIEMGPDFKMSVFDLVAFMTYREANCIGQIALWRRLLGYEAMSYM